MGGVKESFKALDTSRKSEFDRSNQGGDVQPMVL